MELDRLCQDIVHMEDYTAHLIDEFVRLSRERQAVQPDTIEAKAVTTQLARVRAILVDVFADLDDRRQERLRLLAALGFEPREAAG